MGGWGRRQGCVAFPRVISQTRSAARLEEINVETDVDLERRFGLEIPVLLLDGKKVAKFRVSEEVLTRLLRAG